MGIKIGDWVTQYSAGIFKVEKILPLKKSQPIVVLKKGFTNKLKPFVGWDTCAVSLCVKVSNEVLIEIQTILNSNSKFNEKFNEYVIPPIRVLYNMNIILPDKSDKEELLKQLDIQNGKTIQEVERMLKATGTELLGSAQSEEYVNFQLICTDYEINTDGEFIYRNARFY